jgi:predicted ATPase
MKARISSVPEYRMKKQHVNSLWKERIELVEKFLVGTGDKGPVTVMMDEPERSYDLPLQATVWRFLRAQSTRIQFIVASHSVFALNIPEAHYIELESGYLEAAKAAVGLLPKWAEEKPFPKGPGVKKPKAKEAP